MAQLGLPSGNKRPEIFYGWYIVSAAFVVMTVSSGFGFYNLGVYLNAFVEERSFPVGVTSAATASFFLASGFAGLAVGRFIEEYDLRWSVVIGAAISALTLASAPFVDTILELYAFHVFFGIGYAACALLPCTTIVTRWFEQKRPVALSVASTGLSVGGILLTPLSIFLIQKWGMSGAGPWLGLMFFLGVAPIAILMFRASPDAMGLHADGIQPSAPVSEPGRLAASAQTGAPDTKSMSLQDVATSPTRSVPVGSGVPYDEAVKSLYFKLMTASFFFTMMAQVGGIAHHFRLVTVRTDSAETASFLVAVLATTSIVGRLIGGQLLSRIPSRLFVLVLMSTQSCAFLCFTIAASPAALFFSTALFGATVGSLLMMQPLLVAEKFGLHSYGRIFSANNFLTMFGVAAGPAIVGVLYSQLGGYGPALFVMALSSALGCALYAFAARATQNN